MHLILLFENSFSIFQHLLRLKETSLAQVLHALLIESHEVLNDRWPYEFFIKVLHDESIINLSIHYVCWALCNLLLGEPHWLDNLWRFLIFYVLSKVGP